MLIGAEKVFRAAVEIREVAPASPGDENFLAGAAGKLEDRDAAATFPGFRGTEKSRGARTENESIKSARQRNQLSASPQSAAPQGKLGTGEDREICHR